MLGTDRIEVLRAENGEWYWRVVAPNGRVIATSGETFTRKWSAKRAAKRTMRVANDPTKALPGTVPGPTPQGGPQGPEA